MRQHPSNARAQHALASLQGTAIKSDAEYVRQVFDELADTFEEKLVTHLAYKIPWQLLDAIQLVLAYEETAASDWSILDLGCGTGLCGKLFKPLAKRMIGIDLSPQMIEKCRQVSVYDELYGTFVRQLLHFIH